jgi:choline transport protein
MAGDIKSPEDVLPHAMLKAVGFNGVIMFAFAVVLAFTIDDIKAVAASRLPIIQVFHQATGPSRISVNVMVSVLALVIFVAFINNFVSVSRLVHAFAEDNGLPFSSWLQVTQGGMPKNAIYCVTGCLLLLCLLNFSSVALNAFISLAAVALYISYFIPIILLSIKRYRSPDTIAWGKFRLGKWGLAVNVLAMLYILYCLVFMVLPATFPITSANFPYSSIIVSAIVLVATVFWRLGGNKKFTLYKKMT